MINKEKIIELKAKFKQIKGKRFRVPKILAFMQVDELVENKILRFTSQSMLRFTLPFFNILNKNEFQAIEIIKEKSPDYFMSELLKENLAEEIDTTGVTVIPREVFSNHITPTTTTTATANNRIENNRIIENNNRIIEYNNREKRKEPRFRHLETLPPPSLLKGDHLGADMCRVIAFNLMGNKWDKDVKKRPPLYVDLTTVLRQMRERYEFVD